MSLPHMNAARLMRLPLSHKAILLAYANRACQICGLTWATRELIALDAGASTRSVTRITGHLRGAGHLSLVEKPRWGRGIATEHIVLPGLVQTAPAPCPVCRSRMTKPSQPGHLFASKAGQPVSRKVANVSPHPSGVPSEKDLRRRATPDPELENTPWSRLRDRLNTKINAGEFDGAGQELTAPPVDHEYYRQLQQLTPSHLEPLLPGWTMTHERKEA